MAINKSRYLEDAILNHVLRATDLGTIATVYLGLHTSLTGGPDDDNPTRDEVSAGGYARQAATFAAPSAGVCALSSEETFSATADWGQITHVTIWDAATVGNQLYWGPLDTARTVNDGDDFVIKATTGLTVQED